MTAPQLAPPGAGLPKAEAFLIRNLVFPALKLKLSREKSMALFQKSGAEILAMAEPLDELAFSTPVLIKRLPGLEDSSRNWSVEETLEHVQMVTGAAIFIILKLEANQSFELPIRTQDVKPTGALGLDRLRTFREYLAETPERLADLDFSSKATHFHPWFGELSSLDWLRLLAFHQNLHRKQIISILRPASC